MWQRLPYPIAWSCTLTHKGFARVAADVMPLGRPMVALWLVAVVGLLTLLVLLTLAIDDGATPSQDRTVLDWVSGLLSGT